MKNLIALILCSWPLAAQLTLTPATAFTNLVGGTPSPMIWPLGQADGPFPVAIDITGTGNTLAVGACTGTGCADVQTAICVVASSPCTPTATSPATLYVFWKFTSYVLTSVNTYPASFPVTGSTTCNGAASCTVKVSLQIVPAQRATIATRNGLTTGCSTSTPYGANLWPYFAANDLCPALPAVNAFTMPAAGGSYTDQFGGVVKIVAGASGDARTINSDATVASINSDGTLVMNQVNPGGTLKYTNTATFADDYSTSPAEGSWHPTIANRKFEMVGLTITRRDFPAAPTTIFTYSGGGTTSITNGGANNVDAAGKTCFITKGGSHDKVALFDVSSATAVYGTLTFPNANAGSCWTYGLDIVQNKHYIKVMKELPGHGGNLRINDIFSWTPGAPTVVFEFRQPRTPDASAYGYYYGGPVCDDASSSQACLGEIHSTTMNVLGQAFDLYGLQTAYPYGLYAVLMKISSGQLMTTPVEAGGGMSTVAILSTANVSGVHFGAAVTQPVAVISMDGDPAQSTGISSALSGCTNATPRVCTYTSAALSAALSNGTVVKLSGVQGACAATINTSWTIANLNTGAKTFEPSTSTATGTCTSNTGAVILNADPSGQSYQAGILFLDCRLLPCAITRLATSRSFATFGSVFGDTSTSEYYGQSHAGIDPSGRWIGYETNNREDIFRVAVIPTGYNPVSGGSLISGAVRVSGAISVR